MTGTSWLGSYAAFISTEGKKIVFSARFPLLLRIGASPINPSHILLHHLRSSAPTTQLHEKHSRAGCQRTRAHCWIPLRVDPTVGHSGEFCRLQLAVRRMGYMQAGPDASSICQDFPEDDAGEHDLVPEFRFSRDFCGLSTTVCSCFHTPLDLCSLFPAIPATEAPSQQVM